MSHFAGIAGRIEAVIGAALTAKLLAARGGTEISIPTRARGSALAKIIGVEATEKLRDAEDEAFGVGKLTLPMAEARGRGAKRREALQMFAHGGSLSLRSLWPATSTSAPRRAGVKLLMPLILGLALSLKDPLTKSSRGGEGDTSPATVFP